MRSSARKRAVILLAKKPDPNLAVEIAAGRHPRVEYLELARAIGADILDFHSVEASPRPGVRRLARRLGPRWGLAWLGFFLRHDYHHIYATGEDVGIPLGMMFRAARCWNRLTVVMHNADTPKRRALLRFLGHRIYRNVICLASTQRQILIQEIGLPETKVHFLPNWVDQRFFSPATTQPGDYIVSVGMESRDYPTLQAAADGLPYPITVVASGWSPGAGFAPASGIVRGSTITVGQRYSYTELRNLYARARFAVVPLRPVSYAAGVTGVLEPMAMGKPVVVSDSPGILDYVQHQTSGRLVPVGNVEALRRSIVELWENLEMIEAMGSYNRQWIEQKMNTDRYVDSVAELMFSEQT